VARAQCCPAKLSNAKVKRVEDKHVNFETSTTSTMASVAAVESLNKGDRGKSTRNVLKVVILCLIAVAAISSRLFSVISKIYSPCLLELKERRLTVT